MHTDIIQFILIATPIGTAKIEGNQYGISSISVVDNTVISVEIPEIFRVVVAELNAYFENKSSVFSFQMNPVGTDFQKKVWLELCNIPFGKTISYLEMAKRLGDPKVIRAAASANGKNPLWIAVPCHRVIGSDGSMTGYAGGLWRKQWLLEHENSTKQQSLF